MYFEKINYGTLKLLRISIRDEASSPIQAL